MLVWLIVKLSYASFVSYQAFHIAGFVNCQGAGLLIVKLSVCWFGNCQAFHMLVWLFVKLSIC